MDDPTVFVKAISGHGAKGIRHSQEHNSEAARNEFGNLEGPREKGAPDLPTNGGQAKDTPDFQKSRA
jgi:hypothetical protein